MSERIQTLVYRQYVAGPKAGPKVRNRVLAGDRTKEINGQPSYSVGNQTYYHVARLVTSRDRRSLWYADAQWDDLGNSDWL